MLQLCGCLAASGASAARMQRISYRIVIFVAGGSVVAEAYAGQVGSESPEARFRALLEQHQAA